MRVFGKKSEDSGGSWIGSFLRIAAQKLTKRTQQSPADIAASQWWYGVGILPQIHPERIFKDHSAVNSAIDQCGKQADIISNRYSGRMKELTPPQFNQYLVEQEKMAVIPGRLHSFFNLLEAMDVGNIEYAAQLRERLNQSLKPYVKVFDEMMELSSEYFVRMRRAPETTAFYAYLDKLIKAPPRNIPARDQGDEIVQQTAQLDQREGTLREEIELAMLKSPQNSLNAVTALWARQADEYVEIFSERLSFNHKLAAHHGAASPKDLYQGIHNVRGNEIESLHQSVHANIGMVHNYVRWKAAYLGVTQLDSADLFNPIYSRPADNVPISWEDAKRRTITTFTNFAPTFGVHAAAIFNEGRVHAVPSARRGLKNVCIPGTPEIGTFLLVNYRGTSEDVNSIHHEMAHGIHNNFIQQQGNAQHHTSSMIAETAGLFAEKLYFAGEANRQPDSTQALMQRLNGFENRLMTVCTQMMLHDFYDKANTLAVQGKLTKDTLGKEWLNVNRTYFGDAIKFTEQDKHGWINYMPALHTPLHSTAYVYGQLVTNALWDNYKKRGKDFVRDYTDFMKVGGTKPPHEALKSFGFETSSTDFWSKQMRAMGSEFATLTRHTHQIGQTLRPSGLPQTSPQFFNHS
jgi:oligoendopeptidase F